MRAFSEWYFAWGWLLVTMLGFFVGLWAARCRLWWFLAGWMVLVLTINVVADVVSP